MKKLLAIAVLLLALPMLASAQDSDHPYRGQGYAFLGLGTSLGFPSNHPFIQQWGGGGEGFLYKGFGVGAEVGYGYWGSREYQAYQQEWVASGDLSYHFRRHAKRGQVDPFVVGGVTGFFPTSHGRGAPGGNFGGGGNVWFKRRAALRFEFRDHVSAYWNSFTPGNHYLSFRVGATFR